MQVCRLLYFICRLRTTVDNDNAISSADMYFLAFPNDPDRSRLLVLGVYLFEAVQTFLLTQSAFHSFADGFGNLLFLDEIGTIWFSVPIMSGIGMAILC